MTTAPRPHRPHLAALLALVLSLPAALASAGSGSPDPSFGSGGEVVTLVGNGHSRAHAGALQSDGRIVAAGYSADVGQQSTFALARYLADGSLDASFGAGGTVTTSIGSEHDEANAVAIQSDGKILAAGSAGSATGLDAALVRYNVDGSLDSTFGTGGMTTTQTTTAYDAAKAIVLLDAGLIPNAYAMVAVDQVNLALAGRRVIVLVKYNLLISPGTLDTSFGGNGGIGIPGMEFALLPNDAYVGAITRQADGRIVVTGRIVGAGSDVLVLRFLSDGTLDPSFGSGGVVVTDVSGDDSAQAVLVQPDGRIVVAGHAASSSAMFVLRYEANGSVDTSFGTAGSTLVPIAASTYGYGLVRQPDGKLVVAGAAHLSPEPGFALARLTTAGQLDATFGTGGIVHAPVDAASGYSLDYARSLLLQPDGRLVAVGYSDLGPEGHFALTRHFGDCGNANVDSGEQCDDGNLVDGDGCEADCVLTATIEIASVGTGGVQGNSSSFFPAISADGNDVAFASSADSLDGANLAGVFVRDRISGVTERVSVSTAGIPANQGGLATAISPDGRYVAFYSAADNLVAGDTNAKLDVFLRDRLLATTERVSLDSSGNEIFLGIGSAGPLAVTPDGRYVVFCNDADILGDGAPGFQIYLRDRVLMQTERIAWDTVGGAPNGSTCTPAAGGIPISSPFGITDDGRYVVFSTNASDLVDGDGNGVSDVFLRDRQSGTTERISLSSSDGELGAPSYSGGISPDGRWVVFASDAADVVAADTNGRRDLFLLDRQLDAVERVNLTWLGGEANDHVSAWASMSADARYVAFASSATNLVNRDPGQPDIFLRDRQLATTVRISRPPGGGSANQGASAYAAVAADGNAVAFESNSSNLVAGDVNAVGDVFVHAFRCGNFVIDAGEDCDDGNQIDGDGCEYTCHFTPEEVSTAAPAGATVTTDTEGDDATPGDPLETTITTPNAGTVEITEGDVGAVPSGYTILGQRARIVAPPGTAAAPLVLVFRLDASVLPPPGTSVVVLRNGMPLPDCTGAPGEASPDPCIASRVGEGDGDLTITALTSQASDWAIASLQDCGDGDPDDGEQCDLGAANGAGCCDANCLLIGDFDQDGVCSRDDVCPHVAGVAPVAIAAKKGLLVYRQNGPGGGDDAPKLIRAAFHSSGTFDPQTTDDVRVRFVDGSNGGTLFATTLAAGGAWQRTPGKRIWKYRDTARPTAAGVAVALLKEAPAGSGDYTLKVVGRDATLASRLTAGAPLQVVVEISRDGVGECLALSLPTCRAAAAKDVCLP